jgi:amino acid transporter
MHVMSDAASAAASRVARPDRLRRQLSAHHLFALSFGTIIGTGWITGLGIWLGLAGPFGSIAGFALGAVVMLLIGLCYARLAVRHRRSGGAIAYAYDLWGVDAAFASGWCMVLVYVTAISFQTVAIAWMLEALLTPAVRGPALYTAFGENVYAITALAALAVGASIAWLNYRGVQVLARFQSVLTFAKIAIAVVFFACALAVGRVEYLEPGWSADATGFSAAGMWAVFATAPFFLAGFDVIPLAMGETSPHVTRRAVYVAIIGSLVAAAVYYALVILCGALLVPRADLLEASLPTAAAFERAFDSSFAAKAVLAAGLMGVLTCWNSSVFAAGRVLHAMAESKLIPGWFACLHPLHATPARAVLFASILGLLLVPFGRAVIHAIVNTSGSSLAIVGLIVCLGLLRERVRVRRVSRHAGSITGLLLFLFAALGAAFIVVMALAESWRSSRVGAMPVELLIFAAWLSLGAVFWSMTRHSRSTISEAERRARLLGAEVGA